MLKIRSGVENAMTDPENKIAAPCCCQKTEPSDAADAAIVPFACMPMPCASEKEPGADLPWIHGAVDTPAGRIPRVRTLLAASDRLGTIKARWGVGRMDYLVPPGLYAVGEATSESPVFLSANYKMSFDRLRSALAGRSAWILVLDTRGINVWCAAGKGTFGTDEIVRRVHETGLERIVSHRKLVAPQLGATGVSSHQVKARSGFSVVYGPVRAEDLPAFLDAGNKATPGMRRVRFNLRDRAVLVPMELVMGGKYALLLALAFFLLGGVGLDGFAFSRVLTSGLTAAGIVLGTVVASAVLGPVLLPWLPGRAFSIKGAFLGVALVAILAMGVGFGSWIQLTAWALLVPALASFVVMNFTGASTFTSLSGVLREMRYALPAQIALAVVGLGLWLVGLLMQGGAAA